MRILFSSDNVLFLCCIFRIFLLIEFATAVFPTFSFWAICLYVNPSPRNFKRLLVFADILVFLITIINFCLILSISTADWETGSLSDVIKLMPIFVLIFGICSLRLLFAYSGFNNILSGLYFSISLIKSLTTFLLFNL